MKKKRAVVIAPGRGSYTKETMGYLKAHRPAINSFVNFIDQELTSQNFPTVTELDEAKSFKSSLHTKGEHASTLIYACAMADFFKIKEEYEIVAVTGNSMGWYIALAMAGALDEKGAFSVIHTMGSMMKEEVIGGQVIYPIIDESWQKDSEKIKAIEKSMEGLEVYPSISLGGYQVIGGSNEALSELMKRLPRIDNFPFQLINHAAFHTPLMKGTSQKAFELLAEGIFKKPKYHMIDGRGHIWSPWATDRHELYRYTLGHQVYAPYDFTTAVTKALKEFNPDQLILLGPGNSLGGAVGQVLIENNWHGIASKDDFSRKQKEESFLLSMGL
jgi:[acyl-carrier-protein] S-malonyltransferase